MARCNAPCAIKGCKHQVFMALPASETLVFNTGLRMQATHPCCLHGTSGLFAIADLMINALKQYILRSFKARTLSAIGTTINRCYFFLALKHTIS